MVRVKSMTKESERALADTQMLFGSHVYALAKGMTDVALTKGEEAYRAARAIGERSIEFAAAGGVAQASAGLGRNEQATHWLQLAAAVASSAPTPGRMCRLELWRGTVMASAGNAEAVIEHLERSANMAMDQGRPAGRSEALARLALETARLGRMRGDESLLLTAERAAVEVLRNSSLLPGHPPWTAQALAARAEVMIGRGDTRAAADFGRQAIADLEGAMREDLRLETILPAANAIIAGGSEAEIESARERLQLILALQAQRILDEDVRAEWFRSDTGRELTRLSGPLSQERLESLQTMDTGLDEGDSRLLGLLVQGNTNREIADELGVTEQAVTIRLAELFVKIGASSRADATVAALMGGLV
jgi:DNA-binding NarL/FixJ family response regulator